MGLFDKLFGKSSSSVDEELKKACDSDMLKNIARYIGNDKTKYDKVLDYLSQQDNLSMKLRVMTHPNADPQDLMATLMALQPSDATKLNRLCKDGINPVIHFSMYKGMDILIRVIAHAHANLDIIGLNGHTPLTIACESGLAETVKMLINNGAKALNKSDDSGFAPLHYACQLGNSDIVQTLIKAGANVNEMSANKLMPIHLAISTCQAAQMSPTAPNGIKWSAQEALMCVQHLANNGADLNYVCPYGFSALDFLKSIGAVK